MPWLNAAQSSLSIIGECGARLFEISAAHKACVLWMKIKTLDKESLLGPDCKFLLDNLEFFEAIISAPRLK